MSENNPENRNQPLRPNGNFKLWSVWLLIFVAIFSLLYFANGKQQAPRSLSIREVVLLAEQGETGPIQPGAVLKASPQGGPKWHEIRGTLKEGDQEVPLSPKDSSRRRTSKPCRIPAASRNSRTAPCGAT